MPLKNDFDPPNFYDPNDVCKKNFENEYCYDQKSRQCYIPKCNPRSHRRCPKPTKCVQGKYTFN